MTAKVPYLHSIPLLSTKVPPVLTVTLKNFLSSSLVDVASPVRVVVEPVAIAKVKSFPAELSVPKTEPPEVLLIVKDCVVPAIVSVFAPLLLNEPFVTVRLPARFKALPKLTTPVEDLLIVKLLRTLVVPAVV